MARFGARRKAEQPAKTPKPSDQKVNDSFLSILVGQNCSHKPRTNKINGDILPELIEKSIPFSNYERNRRLVQPSPPPRVNQPILQQSVNSTKFVKDGV